MKIDEAIKEVESYLKMCGVGYNEFTLALEIMLHEIRTLREVLNIQAITVDELKLYLHRCGEIRISERDRYEENLDEKMEMWKESQSIKSELLKTCKDILLYHERCSAKENPIISNYWLTAIKEVIKKAEVQP